MPFGNFNSVKHVLLASLWNKSEYKSKTLSLKAKHGFEYEHITDTRIVGQIILQENSQ
jgi:hypothetical protein